MISAITPSCRPDGISIVEKCLKRQSFTDWEWIVTCPQEHFFEFDRLIGQNPEVDLLIDPPKEPGDFWSLCKGWNNAYSRASGELIVNIQDWIWFEPDMLERFWNHYQSHPKALITAVGNHYSELDIRGMPVNEVWQDPRKREDQGTFYEINFPDMEMAVCSVPKQAILDCGGLDEEYDKANGVQEKEMCMRLGRLGYTFWIDQSIEYRALHHPRLTENWDEHYWNITAPLFKQHGLDFLEGKRPLNVGYVKT